MPALPSRLAPTLPVLIWIKAIAGAFGHIVTLTNAVKAATLSDEAV